LVKIRLKRVGTTKRPYYRLVVADSRSPRDGRFIEALGHYDPLADPVKIGVDGEKVKGWMANGARPTDAARSLLEQAGIVARGGRKPIPLRAKRNPEKATARIEAKAKKAAAPPPAPAQTPEAGPTAEATEAEAPAAEVAKTETETPAANAEEVKEETTVETTETPAADDAAPAETKAEDESGS
jgi:small subunit ribosomal protein S16